MARIGSYPIDAVVHDKDAWIGTENTNRVTRQFTAKGIAEYIDTKNVGLVFVGATALADGKKGLVPAPVAGQEGMYLKGDLGGGWTTIPVYTLDVPAGTTNVNLINTDGAGAIINSFITLTGGTYLTGVHTSGSEITFNHDNTTRSDTTSTASPAAGASVPLVASVTSNATGHVTAIDVKTVTWPADSDTTYTIDVPNATTSINLAGSDGTNDPIAFTTVAGNNGMTISRTDANTLNFNSKWQANTVNTEGYVSKGQANANKFWATDANGNPGWTFQPSQDQTLTSTGTTNASTGVVLSQNGGTVIIKGDGSTINASSNNTTNTITLAAINRVNTTYTLPVAAGGANTAVINLTDNSSVVSSVTFNGTANKISISETAGNNGDITIGMPDDVTVTGELTVSGTGQSSFGGQITIPQTPVADTDAASKKYVDDLVSGGLTFRGTFRADTGEILSGVNSGSQLYNCPGGAGTRIAVAVGDYYIVATAGGSFYCSGATLDIGDSIIATAAANADASVVTGWSVVQSDEGVASFTNANGTFVSAGTVNSNATGAVTMGTIDLSATGTKDGTTFLRGDNTWAVPAYVSYSAMTTSTLGLGKIKYDFGSTPAAESQSTTASRTYGVTKNASDQLVVNVPWVNSSDVNSVTASGATTALSGLTSTPNTGSVVIGLDINGRASLGTPAADDELMIYDTSTAKNVKVLVSDLASYAGSAATNQVTYWTSANEIGGATGFTFAGGANGAVTMGGTLTVAGDVSSSGTSKSLKYWRRLWTDANNDWGLNNNAGSAVISVSGMGTPSTSSTTFAGNVGIGAAPSHTLDVKGADTNNATIARFYSNTGTRGSFVINNGTGVSPTAFIGTSGGSEQLSIGTNSTEAIRIDGSQNATFAGDVTIANGKFLKLVRNSGSLATDAIGITSGSDDVRLLTTGDFNFVNGSLTNLLNISNSGNSTFNSQNLDVKGPNAGNTQIRITDSTGTAGTNSFDLINDGTAAYVWNRKQTDLNFATYGSLRMKIRASGTVGIGANGGYDSQMLSIDAGVLDGAIYATSTDANCFASFRDGNSTANIEYGAIGNAHVFRKDSTEYMRIDSSGVISIGPSTTSSEIYFNYNNTNNKGGLKIDYSTGELRLSAGESGNGYHQAFYTNGTQRMRLDSGGSVIIGDGATSGTPTSDYRSLEIGRQGNTITGAPWKSNLYFSTNATVTAGSTAFTYRYATAAPTQMTMENGVFTWSNATAGTVGNTISFTERMRIDSNGSIYNGSTSNTHFGYNALSSVTSADESTAFGSNALGSQQTGRNTAVGYHTLQDLTTGSYNTGVGGEALENITTGSFNTGFGAFTLRQTTTESYNTAVGHLALRNNYNNNNVAIGALAMSNANVTGTQNVSIGTSSMFNLTSGNYNTGVGEGVMSALTTGSYNTAMGREALDAQSTANSTTAIGYQSLTSANADGNAAVGFQAGYGVTSGQYNVIMGHETGVSLTSGSYNVLVGDRTGRILGTGAENTLVGHQTGYSLSGGNYNTCVGFKNLNAAAAGQFNTSMGFAALNQSTTSENAAFGGYACHYSTSATNSAAFGFKALFSQTTAEGNTAFGFQCMEAVSTGAKNTAVGRSAGDSINTGSEHTVLGYSAGDELTTGVNCTAIGFAAGSGSSPRQMTTNSNEIVIGNNSVVGAYIKVAWTATSDKRDKTDFKDVPLGLDFVSKLKPTSYKFRKDRDTEETQGRERYGFLAQEVLELEGDNPVIIDNTDEEKLAYTESNLIPILVNAIQELKAEIEILKNK